MTDEEKNEIKYRLSDIGAKVGELALEYIAELEEEKCELLGIIQGKDKVIQELEKENAELKEQCSILADCNTCYSPCKNENVEMKKQLTKAKEYIKLLLMNCVGVYESTGKTIAEIQIEAEQFLNSDVEQ